MKETTREGKTQLIKLNGERGRADDLQDRRADEIPLALRLMLETIRRALLMAAHAIGKYLGREN